MKTKYNKPDATVRTDRSIARLLRKTAGRPFDAVAYAAALEILG